MTLCHGVVTLEINVPDPFYIQVIAAVEGAAAWYNAVAIRGMRWEVFTNAEGLSDKRIVPDPNGETLWARFYELGTSRPIFTTHGNVVKYSFSELPHDWRTNKHYMYGTWPAKLLSEDYPRWCEKNKIAPKKSEAPAIQK